MRINKPKRHALMVSMNVVPYIDVMLVLLIIFMVTAPMLHQGVRVQLPRAQTEALPTQNMMPMIITVNTEGQYFLNISASPDHPIAKDVLALRVAAERQRYPNRHVLIRGDAKAAYHQVLGAMATLQQAGVQEIGLMTAFDEAAS